MIIATCPLGKDFHIKRTGMLIEEPLTGNKILACGRGMKFLSPLRDANCKTIYYFLSYCFG